MNGCQFQLPRFSAPAGPANVTQEEWDRIFNSEEKQIEYPTYVERGVTFRRINADEAII